MFWFCWHKWGEIKDGYQYCKKCGIAIPVPCKHKWETIFEAEITRENDYGEQDKIGKLYHQKCKECGEIKGTSVDVYG